MKKNIIKIIFFLFIKYSIIESVESHISTTKGITDIIYNSTLEFISFHIPTTVTEESNNPTNLTLNLSYPYRSNRTFCSANCGLKFDIIDNIQENKEYYYYCLIEKRECDLLEDNKKIIIDSIIEPPNYEFENRDSLISEINFEAQNIEMVCSNYKISFFFKKDDLEYHPYDNIEFTFPIYYKDKQETAICIFPKQGDYVPCIIDAGQRIFEKGYFINFEYNKTIELTKDLNLTLKLNKYILEDDCGKNINNGKLICFNLYYLILFFFLFLF